MKHRHLIVAIAALMIAPVSASAQDVEAGAKLFKKQCRSCHGPKAQGMASFPKLVGHPVEFLVSRLETYRSGEKVGPNTALMAPNAKKLSDEDIADVSAFIVSLD